jgi:hypothetical protein
MLSIHCPTHQSEVLLTERRIRSLRNTDQGIIIDVECYCGTHVTIRTGRKRAAAREAAPTRNPALAS